MKINTLFLGIIFVALLFFAGFRWDVGIDWGNYMGFGNSKSFESGNIFIKSLLSASNYEDGGYWLWVMAFIILFFFFYSIWKFSVNPILSAILFICLGMFFDSLNGVRQYVAVALFVYSWQFIFQKRAFRYVITIAIASLFHQSVLILLPMYWVTTFKYSKKYLCILCVLLIPLSFVSDTIIPKIIGLSSQYAVYQEMRFSLSNDNFLSILRMVFPLFLFLFCIKIYDRLSYNRAHLIICNLSFISILLTILFPSVALMIRLGFYFQASFVFIIPIICQYLSANKALIFKTICILYGIGFIYFTQLSKPIAKILPFNLDFRLANIELVYLLCFTFICAVIFIKSMQFSIYRIFRLPNKNI